MSSAPSDYQFKPHERPLMPGSPATPEHPMPRRVAYFCIGVLIGITGGLGNALVTVNLASLQSALGLTTVEAAWVPAIYAMTNVCMSLLLIKFRQQFGLQHFTRLFLLGYIVATLAHLFVHTLPTALALRAISGITASALSTLCLFYIIQSLPATSRLKGMVIGTGVSQIAVPLARTFSPELLQLGQWQTLYYFEMGLALLTLAAVAMLRLPPSERIQVFEKLDLLTFALFAPGVALLCAVLAQGRIQWWTEAPWMGYALCAAVVLISSAMVIEHNRANPLLNTRWLASRDILRFAIVAIAVRILVSEQSVGSVGLLTVLGMSSDQLVRLFAVVTVATIAGVIASAYWLNPLDLLKHLLIALVLIVIGAAIDAHSTNLTRPMNMYFSQAIIGFAAVYFLGPMLMFGMLRALSRGFTHIVSFSALFSITQTLGGLGGSALIGTLQTVRAKAHWQDLMQSVVVTDPNVAGRLQTLAGAYGRVLTDPTLRQAEGAVLLAQQVTREANVLAYNDLFRLIAVVAFITLIWLSARYIRLRVRGENPTAEALAAIQRMRSAQ
jgi:MFS family permease